MFLWISVALPNTPSILSLASCSHLPVFPLMHYPSHIPWDSDRATNHSIDPTRGLSDWPSSWAHASRWPIRIFPWMFMYGYREKKNELSLGVGTTLLEDLRVSSTQSFLAWEAPNSTHLGVSGSCGRYYKSLQTWWPKRTEIYSLIILKSWAWNHYHWIKIRLSEGQCSLQRRICSMLLLAPGGCLHSLASGDITPTSASVFTLPIFRLHPIFPCPPFRRTLVMAFRAHLDNPG